MQCKCCGCGCAINIVILFKTKQKKSTKDSITELQIVTFIRVKTHARKQSDSKCYIKNEKPTVLELVAVPRQQAKCDSTFLLYLLSLLVS